MIDRILLKQMHLLQSWHVSITELTSNAACIDLSQHVQLLLEADLFRNSHCNIHTVQAVKGLGWSA